MVSKAGLVMTNLTAASRERPELDPARYFHPRIDLIDLKDDSEAMLRKDGWNISSGSFGVPYSVPKWGAAALVKRNGALPDFAEQEIVMLDLVSSDPIAEPDDRYQTFSESDDFWCLAHEGMIDPRPYYMAAKRQDADRILAHGGIFVIFADDRREQVLQYGHPRYGMGFGRDRNESASYDNWGFLSWLTSDRLRTSYDGGTEITVTSEAGLFGELLREHSSSARFLCTLVGHYTTGTWIPLLVNKYGDTVGCAISAITDDSQPGGWILIFPQFHDKASFLRDLIRNVLPDLSPHLFPEFEERLWTLRPEYEHPEVLRLQDKIEYIRAETGRQIDSIRTEVENERTSRAYQHALLTATGPDLVEATAKALATMGFSDVVDVDGEKSDRGSGEMKREDLQIRDRPPLLLIEVKGISSLPRESDALQIWKYIAPRMKELSSTEVAGLAIVNHQRHLPPLERENDAVFSEDVLTNAEKHGFGLLTTWDLFRLLRSFEQNGWRHEHVRDLLYRHGRIQPVPSHYQPIGSVEKYWAKPGAVGIALNENGLAVGDRIAFELPEEYVEQDIESLEVNNEAVKAAQVGELAGVKTNFGRQELRKRTRVFRVLASGSTA